MTAQNFIDFMARVSADSELQAQVVAKPTESIIAVGAAMGYLFTAADIQDASAQLEFQDDNEDQELTLDQLSAASGGANVVAAKYIAQWLRVDRSAFISSSSTSGGKL